MSIGLTSRSSTSPTRSSAAAKKATRASSARRKMPIKIELKRQHRFVVADVDRIDVEVFDVAYKIIGGGEEGDKSIVCTKEDADQDRAETSAPLCGSGCRSD